MRLATCIGLVLVIMEGSYCMSSTSVETTGSSWGYQYNLNDSRGVSAKYDKTNGLQISPLDNQKNTGFHKKYTERTVHDQFLSKDGQPPTHKLTVNEYVETNKPSSTDNPTSPDDGKTVPTTTMSPPYGNVDPLYGPAPKLRPSNGVTSPGGPDTPMNKVPTPHEQSKITPQNVHSTWTETDARVNNAQAPAGQSGTLANNLPPPLGQPGMPASQPGNQGHPTYGATNSFPQRIPVGNLPNTVYGSTFNTPYGYNLPPYRSFGPPVYNNPNPMYGEPSNQMYNSWQQPSSAYGQPGSAYGPPGSAYSPTGLVYERPVSAYGGTSQDYLPTSSPPTLTQRSQSGQTYGPEYDHFNNMPRRPMYGVPQRIYY